jgi:glycosyltransferase involved in cell wall biosynthesis
MLTVSIVIPTFNRLARLKRVIACLEAQDYPHASFEVIVAADGCTDGTSEHLASLAQGGASATSLRLVAVEGENQGPGGARNRGIAAASGRLVLFIDDDVMPAPHLVSEHVRTHERHAAGRAGSGVAVLGPMMTPPDARLLPWVHWEQVTLERQYADMIAGRWQPTARQFYTGNTSLELAAVRAAGGFDTRFRRAEDVELAYRLAANGVRFVFNPQAVGYHYAERSYRAWRDAAYAYGRADVVFSRDLGQAWLLPRLAHELRHNRHPLIRAAVNVCLDRPALAAPAIAAMRLVADAGSRMGQDRLADLACSGIFNLRHYQGIADELGGRAQFFATMAQAAEAPVPGALEGGALAVNTTPAEGAPRVSGGSMAGRGTLPEAK